MNVKALIENSKGQILPELFEWSETFDLQFDDEGEKTIEPYNEVFTLAKRLELGDCNENDYENILFHIEQINYNEIKIRL
jgi:hypothetical protein